MWQSYSQVKPTPPWICRPLLRAELVRFSRADAREAGCDGEFVGIRRERPRPEVAIGTRQLDLYEHVGHAVLERLERTDRTPKGVALHGVVAREREAAVGTAELLEREQNRCAILELGRDLVALSGAAQLLGRCAVERDARL